MFQEQLWTQSCKLLKDHLSPDTWKNFGPSIDYLATKAEEEELMPESMEPSKSENGDAMVDMEQTPAEDDTVIGAGDVKACTPTEDLTMANGGKCCAGKETTTIYGEHTSVEDVSKVKNEQPLMEEHAAKLDERDVPVAAGEISQ